MSGSLVELYEYDLPLTRPLRLKSEVLTRRRGLILKFGPGDQERGYGDIAPLPGFSQETLDDARQAVIEWAQALGSLPKTQLERDQALGFLDKTPSVQFAIECATFNFRRAIGSTRSMGLFSPSRNRLSLNGLLTGALEEALPKAERLRDEGYRAAKVKVGRQNVGQDIDLVHRLRDALGAGMALRLDANRAWDLDTALEFARGIAGVTIEYIEEPVSDPNLLPEFARRSGLPIALDETLVEHRHERGYLQRQDWVKAVVLKPTLLGGVMFCERLAYEALEFGIRPVVSSSFESGLGLILLAHFATAITSEDIPAGLDTYGWLESDVLGTRFKIRNGALDLEEADACAATLDTNNLNRVYSD